VSHLHRTRLAPLLSLGLFLALLFAGFAFTLMGPVSVLEPLGLHFWTSPIWQDRASRVAAAALCGATLSLCGLTLQGLTRNPLAEPYVLGLSSGAAVGVIAGMAFAERLGLAEVLSTPLLAFVGAAVTLLAVYAAARRRGQIDPYALILSGVMIGTMNGAIVMALYLVLEPARLASFLSWSMGQVPDRAEWPLLIATGTGALIALSWVWWRGPAFDLLGLGDDVAASSGVPLRRLKLEALLVAGLATACAVSLCGPVGFVGLVVPHVLRLVIGPSHRALALACALGGALFLSAADTACRAVAAPLDIGKLPVGVATALVGGPVFIYLLRHRETRSQP
jgi:iron complex transport system permease protein